MLKTSEERVRLLKKGIKIKTIEELYIRHNKIKLIQSPILFDLFEHSSSNSIGSPDIPAIELKHDKITDRDPISMRTQSLYMNMLHDVLSVS
ncbi:MAG: hypothetical protein PHH85_03640 [Candidatus Methanoperedens sp.]|nr:hypothetical protein [Candidatus Methanoperedens sp.]